VRAALTATTEAQPALDVVEEALRAGLDASDPRVARIEAAVAALEGAPAASIASIAAGLGISHGHLDREFRRIVGLGPLVLARILRLRRLVDGIDVYGQIGWTALAAELGWFDQAHLIRDFRRFTGVTPSEYAAAQRAVYSPAEAHPGFVPEHG
jgi:AraC-like DNA-binding protein